MLFLVFSFISINDVTNCGLLNIYYMNLIKLYVFLSLLNFFISQVLWITIFWHPSHIGIRFKNKRMMTNIYQLSLSSNFYK